MITLTKEFRRALAANDRNYDARAVIILEDSTRIELQGDEIWSDGFAIEDAVSDDEAFSALGSTVINAATLIIDNTKDKYIDYNFNNADVTLFITKTFRERTEVVKMGTYRVDDTKYDEATITLSMLDMMEQFDRPYVPISYPASLESIVRDACAVCLGTASKLATQTFPHSQFMIQEAPTDEACTYREVISWCATIAGCFARCNRNGELELKWFNTAALEDTSGTDGGEFDSTSGSYYQTGDAVDGGTFSPWSTGAAVDGGNFTDNIPLHYIGSLYSQTICVDETVITGVQIEVEDPDPQAEVKAETYMEGQPGYIIQVSKNPFITKDNVEEILAWLADELVGLRFRKCNVTHADDPSIEAGDVAFLYDSRQREYPILITRHAFEIGGPQTIVCGCETPARNQATRFTAVTKAYVENRKQLKQQKNAYEEALRELAEDIAENAHGLYAEEIEDPDDPNANIYCLHDKPNIEDSDVQIRLSTVGIVVTANGTAQQPTWYGLRVNGDMITRIMNTIGINFDWGTGGTLTLGGANNTNGILLVKNASGTTIVKANNNGLEVTGGKITGPEISGATIRGSTIYGTTINGGTVKGGRIESEFSYYYSGSTYNSLAYIDNGKFFFKNASSSYDRDVGGLYIKNNDGWIVLSCKSVGGGVAGSFASGIAFELPGYTEQSYSASTRYGMMFYLATAVSDAPVMQLNSALAISAGTKRGIVWCESDDYRWSGSTNVGIFPKSTNGYNTLITLIKGGCEIESGLWVDGSRVYPSSSSSKRYKHDINYALTSDRDAHRLLELPVAEFVFNKDHNVQYPGMEGKKLPGIIAEDVEKIYPSATIHNDKGEVESWDERRILPGMLALIQEQHKRLDEQQKEIESLKEQVNELMDAVRKLTGI